MKASDRILSHVVEKIGDAITEAEGREILCVCSVGSDGLVESMTVAARGNEGAVPALMPFMERGDVVIHNHPSGSLRPSSADLGVASHLGNLGIGFYIVDNDVENVYVVAEAVEQHRTVPLDVDDLKTHLQPGGSLDRIASDFESRNSQIEMLDAVTRAFNGNSICVAEAGTGVGKSLAYLIPAAEWIRTNDERVVVSTATINLQQQLVDKDIPMVGRMLGFDIPAVLVKGRGNYVCLRRLAEAEAELGFTDGGEGADVESLRRWAQNSPTGSISDLPFKPDQGLWSQVCSESDSCIGLRCSLREGCFFLKARRAAAAARLLVVNHHLLFSDLSFRIAGAGFEETAVLPPFKRLVFDEAHSIENSATSFFSSMLSRTAVTRRLSRLYRQVRGRSSGLVLTLQQFLGPDEGLQSIPAAIEKVRSGAEALEAYAVSAMDGPSIRIVPGREVTFTSHLVEYIGSLHTALLDLIQILDDVLNRIPEESADEPAVYEAHMNADRLRSYAEICLRFSDFEHGRDNVLWVEKRRSPTGEASASLVVTPLEIRDIMREAVYEPYATVVCTSATLTVQGDFGYWMGRVGLEGFDGRPIAAESFPSPFPYRERVLLGVPSNAPDPSTREYLDFAASFCGDVLELSEGRGLVLFTSYEMLSYVYERVKPRLERMGITVMRQGDDDRSRLLLSFNTDIASVLFATDSFWQGVDAPGESLQVVIICRLPFRVPTDPVVMARMEAIERRGGNAFIELSLPEAVMKFRQGFGRLMRRTSDRGVVLVLDPRIMKKAYGKMFLESLPETRRSLRNSESVIQDIEDFLYAPS